MSTVHSTKPIRATLTPCLSFHKLDQVAVWESRIGLKANAKEKPEEWEARTYVPRLHMLTRWGCEQHQISPCSIKEEREKTWWGWVEWVGWASFGLNQPNRLNRVYSVGLVRFLLTSVRIGSGFGGNWFSVSVSVLSKFNSNQPLNRTTNIQKEERNLILTACLISF